MTMKAVSNIGKKQVSVLEKREPLPVCSNSLLEKLKDEIYELYPHMDYVETSEVKTEFFVRWCGLNQTQAYSVDLQTAVDDFEEWILSNKLDETRGTETKLR